MKKVFSVILALVMCLSLCACSGGLKLSAEDVEEALADCEGTLDLETSDNNVTSFTFVIEDVNADDLVNKEYLIEAITTILEGDTSKVTLGQVNACKAVIALFNINNLFTKEDDDSDALALVEKTTGIICDGNTVEYDGWSVSSKVDLNSDRITIMVDSK